MSISQSSASTGQGITRRRLTTGVAWTAPVIAVASAAPAMAASGRPPIGVAGSACKLPGGSCSPLIKGYLFPIDVTNPNTTTIYLYASTFVITEDSPDISLTFEVAAVSGFNATTCAAANGTWVTGDPYCYFYPGDSIPVPAGGTVQLLLNAGTNANSQNVQDLNGTITSAWGHTANPAGDTDHIGDPMIVNFSSASTPPCSNCAP